MNPVTSANNRTVAEEGKAAVAATNTADIAMTDSAPQATVANATNKSTSVEAKVSDTEMTKSVSDISASKSTLISKLISELVDKSTESQAGQVIYPPLNAEIQVLWELHNDEKGTVEEVWWSAQVQGSEAPPGKERVHFLLYVAHDEFDEEVARVRFLPNHELEDLSSGAEMKWRMAPAETVVKPPAEVVLLRDVMDTSSSPVVQDAALEALAKLPASKQIDIAERYRALADRVKESLVQLAESRGEEYVVTEGDIHSIFRSLNQ